MKKLVLLVLVTCSGLSAFAQQASDLSTEYTNRRAALAAQQEEAERQRIQQNIEHNRILREQALERVTGKAMETLTGRLGKQPIETNIEVTPSGDAIILHSRNTDGTVCRIVAVAGHVPTLDIIAAGRSDVCL